MPPPPLPTKREELTAVNVGLGCHYARLLLLLVLVLCGVAVVVMTMFGLVKFEPPGPLWLLLPVALGAGLLMAVLELTGNLCCLLVPRAAGAFGIILASFLLDVSSYALWYFQIVNGPALAKPEIRVADIVQLVMRLASWVLFMVFLNRLTQYLRDPELGNYAISVLRLGLWLMGVLVFAPLLLGVLAVSGGLSTVVDWVSIFFWFGVAGTVIGLTVSFPILLWNQLWLIGRLRERIWTRT
jgi:hypothetical protein